MQRLRYSLTFATALALVLAPLSAQPSPQFPVPPQLGALGVGLFLQAVFTDVTAGCMLGSPTAMLLLDSRY